MTVVDDINGNLLGIDTTGADGQTKNNILANVGDTIFLIATKEDYENATVDHTVISGDNVVNISLTQKQGTSC